MKSGVEQETITGAQTCNGFLSERSTPKSCLLRLTVGKKERVKSTFIAASVPQIYDILH